MDKLPEIKIIVHKRREFHISNNKTTLKQPRGETKEAKIII